MGKPSRDLTGQIFGRWRVLRRGEKGKNGHVRWVCLCECGAERLIYAYSLIRRGSCGCNECRIKRQTKHGRHKDRLYQTWRGMVYRCTNPISESDRKIYGRDGVAVCEEWHDDFDAFEAWAIANGYKADLSIDRIDNDLGYSPDNCRWATATVQATNRRNNKLAEYKGELLALSEVARRSGISYRTILARAKRGVPDRLLTYRGRVYS